MIYPSGSPREEAYYCLLLTIIGVTIATARLSGFI